MAEKDRIPINTKYINPRISHDAINWFVSVCVETDSNTEIKKDKGIGIKSLSVCSDGVINKTENIKKSKKKQRRLQREISKKYIKNKEGESYCKTSNVIKAEKKLLKVNHRLTGIRHNYIHQMTTEIMLYSIRGFECKWNNIKFMEANRFYPSSKLCSKCGHIHKQLKLSDRICKNEIDRDYQASINLYNYGKSVI